MFSSATEVDGKLSVGMPLPVPTFHCCIRYSWKGGYPGGEVLFGDRGCLCCVQQRHRKKPANPEPWSVIMHRITDRTRDSTSGLHTYFTYIHSVSKKLSTLWLALTLSNLSRFLRFVHCWQWYEICYKTEVMSHHTLNVLLHYLGKSKVQISEILP